MAISRVTGSSAQPPAQGSTNPTGKSALELGGTLNFSNLVAQRSTTTLPPPPTRGRVNILDGSNNIVPRPGGGTQPRPGSIIGQLLGGLIPGVIIWSTILHNVLSGLEDANIPLEELVKRLPANKFQWPVFFKSLSDFIYDKDPRTSDGFNGIRSLTAEESAQLEKHIRNYLTTAALPPEPGKRPSPADHNWLVPKNNGALPDPAHLGQVPEQNLDLSNVPRLPDINITVVASPLMPADQRSLDAKLAITQKYNEAYTAGDLSTLKLAFPMLLKETGRIVIQVTGPLSASQAHDLLNHLEKRGNLGWSSAAEVLSSNGISGSSDEKPGAAADRILRELREQANKPGGRSLDDLVREKRQELKGKGNFHIDFYLDIAYGQYQLSIGPNQPSRGGQPTPAEAELQQAWEDYKKSHPDMATLLEGLLEGTRFKPAFVLWKARQDNVEPMAAALRLLENDTEAEPEFPPTDYATWSAVWRAYSAKHPEQAQRISDTLEGSPYSPEELMQYAEYFHPHPTDLPLIAAKLATGDQKTLENIRKLSFKITNRDSIGPAVNFENIFHKLSPLDNPKTFDKVIVTLELNIAGHALHINLFRDENGTLRAVRQDLLGEIQSDKTMWRSHYPITGGEYSLFSGTPIKIDLDKKTFILTKKIGFIQKIPFKKIDHDDMLISSMKPELLETLKHIDIPESLTEEKIRDVKNDLEPAFGKKHIVWITDRNGNTTAFETYYNDNGNQLFEDGNQKYLSERAIEKLIKNSSLIRVLEVPE